MLVASLAVRAGYFLQIIVHRMI